ncbi:MAG: hypothetical protein II593_05725, partial [Prevotella sp.]|nr:hypothetical protein [Prevotella sp.]
KAFYRSRLRIKSAMRKSNEGAAVNVRNEQKSIQLPAQWTGQEVTDAMTDKQTTLKETLALEPYQYLILKK